MNLQFEWDEKKEQINIAKHGIDFATASHVFLDPDRLEYFDEKHSTINEDRYITIGFVEDILTVVYTEPYRCPSDHFRQNRDEESEGVLLLWDLKNLF